MPAEVENSCRECLACKAMGPVEWHEMERGNKGGAWRGSVTFPPICIQDPAVQSALHYSERLGKAPFECLPATGCVMQTGCYIWGTVVLIGHLTAAPTRRHAGSIQVCQAMNDPAQKAYQPFGGREHLHHLPTTFNLLPKEETL